MVPRHPGEQPAGAPLPEGRLQRRHRRPGRPPGARRQRDAALLPERGGAGGTRRVPREACARLLALPAPAVTRGRAWVAALRPRTLPAAIAPVAVGTAAAARSGHVQPGVALAALAAALLLQIGTNLVNDWGDFRRGADGPDRLGPRRARSQSGWLSAADVVRGAAVAFGAAALVGVWLDRARRLADRGDRHRRDRRRGRLHGRALAARLPRPGRTVRVPLLRAARRLRHRAAPDRSRERRRRPGVPARRAPRHGDPPGQQRARRGRATAAPASARSSSVSGGERDGGCMPAPLAVAFALAGGDRGDAVERNAAGRVAERAPGRTHRCARCCAAATAPRSTPRWRRPRACTSPSPSPRRRPGVVTIRDVRILSFALPLRRPLATAYGRVAARRGFVVVLSDAEGHEGIGEATPHPAAPSSQLASLREELERLKPQLRGRELPPVPPWAAPLSPVVEERAGHGRTRPARCGDRSFRHVAARWRAAGRRAGERAARRHR